MIVVSRKPRKRPIKAVITSTIRRQPSTSILEDLGSGVLASGASRCDRDVWRRTIEILPMCWSLGAGGSDRGSDTSDSMSDGIPNSASSGSAGIFGSSSDSHSEDVYDLNFPSRTEVLLLADPADSMLKDWYEPGVHVMQ